MSISLSSLAVPESAGADEAAAPLPHSGDEEEPSEAVSASSETQTRDDEEEEEEEVVYVSLGGL